MTEAEQERERIVAWLRGLDNGQREGAVYATLAVLIGRGEHLKGKP